MTLLDDFDYHLPEDRIAQRPAPDRDASRLLIVDRGAGAWRDARFPDIVEELQPGDLLVVNDTRVFPARLYARRTSGARLEVLLTHALDGETGKRWRALVRPARKARIGERMPLIGDRVEGEEAAIRFVDEGRAGGEKEIELETPGDPWAWITAHGHVPLPPYIERADDVDDRDRYQTVYARHRGAVAAPTAGLHFSEPLLARLAERGVELAALTLHVGPGTFRPITTPRLEDHVMDGEWFSLPARTAQAMAAARERGSRVVAVGTTTVRALESVDADPSGRPRAGSGWTDLFIRPGHAFRWVDALVTNFHLPQSTLLVLVSTLAGRDLMLAAYEYAVAAEYRFYSYGDAMLIV